MKFSFAFFCAPSVSLLANYFSRSIYFLTALSVDRALAVTRPTTSTVLVQKKNSKKRQKSTIIFKIKHKVVRTRRGFRIISVVIWVGSIALSLPEIIYSKVEHDEWNITICHMTFPVATNETGHETEARRVQVFFFLTSSNLSQTPLIKEKKIILRVQSWYTTGSLYCM